MLNTDALNGTSNASVYTDFNGLAKLKQGAREQSPAAIKEVAQQFESIFLNMVMKSMRQAKLADSVMDSKQSEFFRDMYDQQMAVQLAGKPGIGLADMIVKQLSPKSEPNEDEKMQAGDYLNRAMGDTGPIYRNMPTSESSDTNVNPMEESGLNRLQRNLQRMEKSQQDLQQHWDAMKIHGQDQLEPGALSVNKQLFIDQLMPHAQQAADELGVDANLLLAQAALESGWGKSVIKNANGESSHNLFNIKADKSWAGQQTRVATTEFSNGVPRKEVAGFRRYDSFKDSFDDYVAFIKSNPRYSQALQKAGNAGHYIRELQKAGYATDPRYAEKIMSIYHSRLAARSEIDAG